MKASHVLLVALFSIGMGVGQLLLKFAASRQVAHEQQGLFARLLALAFDWPFLLGAASYFLLLVYWVWLLTFLPLSRAYPFTLLSLAVAAVGSAVLFQEPLTPRFIAGLSVIAVGLLVLGLE
jgi:multidrug transporter EmrE-like cation transporter